MQMNSRPLAIVCLCSVLLTPRIKAQTTNKAPLPANKTSSYRLIELGLRLRRRSLDCSHFVHALYMRLGLTYQYATSRRLYRGIRGFERMTQPRSGDLIVWPGHVGVVLEPEQHTFLSAIASGVKISSYSSSYWMARGRCRFFHFASADTQLSAGREEIPTPSEDVGG